MSYSEQEYVTAGSEKPKHHLCGSPCVRRPALEGANVGGERGQEQWYGRDALLVQIFACLVRGLLTNPHAQEYESRHPRVQIHSGRP